MAALDRNDDLFDRLVNRMELTEKRTSRHECYLGEAHLAWGFKKDGRLEGLFRLVAPNHPIPKLRDVCIGVDFSPESKFDGCEACLLNEVEKFAHLTRDIAHDVKHANKEQKEKFLKMYG